MRLIASLFLIALGCAGSPVSDERAQRSHAPIEQAAVEDPPPIQPTGATYAIGDLPGGYGEVRWPAPPVIRSEVRVSTIAEAERALAQSGTRVVVTQSLSGRVTVRADDIEIAPTSGVRIDHVLIDRAKHRIRFAGGRYGTIEMHVPAQHVPPPTVFRAEWLVTDVTID